MNDHQSALTTVHSDTAQTAVRLDRDHENLVQKSASSSFAQPESAPLLVEDALFLVFNHLSLHPDLIRASHVSRLWRRSAHSHPTFWQRPSINVTSTRDPASKVALFIAQLDSSIRADIEVRISWAAIDIVDVYRSDPNPRIIRALRQHAHRFRVLSLRVRWAKKLFALVIQLLNCESGETTSMECLGELELVDALCRTSWTISPMLSTLAPQLKRITLYGPKLKAPKGLRSDPLFPRLECLFISRFDPNWNLGTPSIELYFPTEDVYKLFNLLGPLHEFHSYAGHASNPSQVNFLARCAATKLQTLGLSWWFLRPILHEMSIQRIPTLITDLGSMSTPDERSFFLLDADPPKPLELELLFAEHEVEIFDRRSRRRRRARVSIVQDVWKSTTIATQLVQITIAPQIWTGGQPSKMLVAPRLDTIVLQQGRGMERPQGIVLRLTAPALRVLRLELEAPSSDAAVIMDRNVLDNWLRHDVLPAPQTADQVIVEVGDGVQLSDN